MKKLNPRERSWEGQKMGYKKEEKLKVVSALAGNRTRVNCLEGSYANHYTTNARCLFQWEI